MHNRRPPLGIGQIRGIGRQYGPATSSYDRGTPSPGLVQAMEAQNYPEAHVYALLRGSQA
jgi:hypothetical protein